MDNADITASEDDLAAIQITDFYDDVDASALLNEPKLELDNKIQLEGLPECHMVNVVCTYSLGVNLSLKKIALFAKFVLPCKFNPDGFAAMRVILKTPYLPPTTALVFASSNVVHTGAKTEEHGRHMAWLLAAYLNSYLAIPALVKDFKIRNIVSHFNVGNDIDLHNLAAYVGGRAIFEPNKIHACRVRDPDDPKRVSLYFPSGAVVLTGLKRRSEIEANYRSACELAKLHKSTKKIAKGEYRYMEKRERAKRQTLDCMNKRLIAIEAANEIKKLPIGSKVNISNLIKDVDRDDIPYKRALNIDIGFKSISFRPPTLRLL